MSSYEISTKATIDEIRDTIADGECVLVYKDKIEIDTQEEQNERKAFAEAKQNTMNVVKSTIDMSRLLIIILESELSDEIKSLSLREYKNQLDVCKHLGY